MKSVSDITNKIICNEFTIFLNKYVSVDILFTKFPVYLVTIKNDIATNSKEVVLIGKNKYFYYFLNLFFPSYSFIYKVAIKYCFSAGINTVRINNFLNLNNKLIYKKDDKNYSTTLDFKKFLTVDKMKEIMAHEICN